MNPEGSEQGLVVVLIGVIGGQEFVAVENAVRAREKAPSLRFVRHAFPPGGEANMGTGHQNSGNRNGANELDRIKRGDFGHRRAGDAHQHVERYRFGCARQAGERQKKRGPIPAGFTHAQNAAGAHIDAAVAHMGEGFQSIFKTAGADDFAIKLGRGVDVVIVVIEAGGFEPFGLWASQHPEGNASLHAHGLDGMHHVDHALKLGIGRVAPGRTHAEAGRAVGARGEGCTADFIKRQQLLSFQPGIVFAALGAVRTIFWAGAGFNRKQGTDLHGVGVEMRPMNAVRLKQQVVEGEIEQRQDAVKRPAGVGSCHTSTSVAGRSSQAFKNA